MFNAKKMKWLIGVVISIGLVAMLVMPGCKAAAPPETAALEADLAAAKADLREAEARIGELEAGVAPEAEYHWVMASELPDAHPCTELLDVFCDFVEYYSEGRIKVDRFYGGALGWAWEILDGLMAGDITVGMTEPYAEFHPHLALGARTWMPTSWMGHERLNQQYYNGINDRIMSNAWEELGLHRVLSSHGGPHTFFTVDKPIRTPADLEGLKIRAWGQPVILETLKKLGTLPTMLAYEEQYSAMQTKLVDGTFHTPLNAVDGHWYEVANYFCDLNCVWENWSYAMNKEVYDTLPEDLRAVVDKAGVYASMHHASNAQLATENAFEQLEAEGMTYIKLTDAERAAFMEVLKPEEVLEEIIRPLLGDALYQEWKAEVLRVKEVYG